MPYGEFVGKVAPSYDKIFKLVFHKDNAKLFQNGMFSQCKTDYFSPLEKTFILKKHFSLWRVTWEGAWELSQKKKL
ncbi:MAG: hypothetical protein GY739_10805 [Mesoflavibacter sp.]|nr:hypothetical protein [Mesoflavibacter sp.]